MTLPMLIHRLIYGLLHNDRHTGKHRNKKGEKYNSSGYVMLKVRAHIERHRGLTALRMNGFRTIISHYIRIYWGKWVRTELKYHRPRVPAPPYARHSSVYQHRRIPVDTHQSSSCRPRPDRFCLALSVCWVSGCGWRPPSSPRYL